MENKLNKFIILYLKTNFPRVMYVIVYSVILELQQTRLGQYIEMRVNNFLKKKESGAGEVTVRVVSSSQKYVEVKPGMKAR